jgi:hypothetical protein
LLSPLDGATFSDGSLFFGAAGNATSVAGCTLTFSLVKVTPGSAARGLDRHPAAVNNTALGG